MQKRENVLTEGKYKSFEWIDKAIIAESMFREYDLRNNIKPLKKSGNDIPASLNENGFRLLGQAYGTYIQQKYNQKKIVVSSDYRSYSRGMAYAFMTGVMSTGVDIIDIGTSLTPVLYFAQ
jgi:phosphomannomutase/phosphoglucomutase